MIGLISTPVTSLTPKRRCDSTSRPPPTPITAPVFQVRNGIGEISHVKAQEAQTFEVPIEAAGIQLVELGKGGCSKIYSETASGARISRPQLQSLLKALDPGEVVVVTRLDRLARSTIDRLTTIKQIADNGCLFKSLADPWCDTTTPGGRLMLTVLGGLAEFERELIKARTSEGRERANVLALKWDASRSLALIRSSKSAQERQTENPSALFARSYLVSPNTISRVR